MADPSAETASQSYLIPGTSVLRNNAGLTDPTALAVCERVVSNLAE